MLNGGMLIGGMLNDGVLNGGMLIGGMLNGGMLNGGMLNGGMLNRGMLNGGILNGGSTGQVLIGGYSLLSRRMTAGYYFEACALHVSMFRSWKPEKYCSADFLCVSMHQDRVTIVDWRFMVLDNMVFESDGGGMHRRNIFFSILRSSGAAKMVRGAALHEIIAD